MNEDYQKRYYHLCDLVRKMMTAQKAAFKGDRQKHAIAKNYERKVDALINPSKESLQFKLDWLAQ